MSESQGPDGRGEAFGEAGGSEFAVTDPVGAVGLVSTLVVSLALKYELGG